MSVTLSEQDLLSLYGEDIIYFNESVSDVWQNCVLESIKSVFPIILQLVIVNFLFGTLISSIGNLPEKYFHVLSGIFGIYLLGTLENNNARVVLCTCFIASYIFLLTSDLLQRKLNIRQSNFIKLSLISGLVLSEYFLVDPEIWMQVRGIIMILTMKVISLSHDYETDKQRLSWLKYFGYVCCCANVLFGPWISYNEYYNLYVNRPKKNIWWVLAVFKTILMSVFFLTLSNCWATYLVPDDYNRWIVAYREAFSFRTSHYFICYLSEASMLTAGYINAKSFIESGVWTYTVTNPLEIEFPSALANVVTNWNRPMHEFLKRYVYRSWLQYGNFAAIFATFVMSSFLHGFEFKVSVVLITIGIFSYLQLMPREIVADCISCCVRVRRCKNCEHLHKRNSWRARLINLIYATFTVLHLAYLGVLMDSSTDEVGVFNKWKDLYFISHLIMVVNVLIII